MRSEVVAAPRLAGLQPGRGRERDRVPWACDYVRRLPHGPAGRTRTSDPEIATVERREAGSRSLGRGAPHQRPRAGHGTHYRVLAAPGRLSALRHPLIGGATEEANSEPGVANREKRGREKRERSEDESRDGRLGFLFAIRYSPLTSGLFDIVIMTAGAGHASPCPSR